MGLLIVYLITSVIVLLFSLYVEDLYRFNVEPEDNDFTCRNNKFLILVLCFVPVFQYITLVFFIVKYVIFKLEFKDAKQS